MGGGEGGLERAGPRSSCLSGPTTAPSHQTHRHACLQNNVRRGFERLLRKLLSYPNRPAVVLVRGGRGAASYLGPVTKLG
jgi:hypothetical protein